METVAFHEASRRGFAKLSVHSLCTTLPLASEQRGKKPKRVAPTSLQPEAPRPGQCRIRDAHEGDGVVHHVTDA